MQDEHASAPTPGQDPWRVPGAFSGLDPLQPETPPAGQWAAIEARMRRKRRRLLFWWFATGILAVGLGTGTYLGMDRNETPAVESESAAVQPEARSAAGTSPTPSISNQDKEVEQALTGRRDPSSAHSSAQAAEEGQERISSTDEGILPSVTGSRPAPEAPRAAEKVETTEAARNASFSAGKAPRVLIGISKGKRKLPKARVEGSLASAAGSTGSTESEAGKMQGPVGQGAPSFEVGKATGASSPPSRRETAGTPSVAMPEAAVATAPTPVSAQDSLPDTAIKAVATQDSASTRNLVPVEDSQKKRFKLAWFLGAGALSSTDRLRLPQASSAGGARVTSLEVSRGWQAFVGITLPRLSTDRLQTELAALFGGMTQAYTLQPGIQGEPSYTYREAGDTLVAIPNRPAPEQKRSRTLQVGLQPSVRYRLGRKGLAVYGGAGLWALWQTGDDARPMKLQLQPEAGLATPLFWKLELQGSVRYQGPLPSQFGSLQGTQQRFYYGLSLVWRR